MLPVSSNDPSAAESGSKAQPAMTACRAVRPVALDARLHQRSAVRFVRLTLFLISTAVCATVGWASFTHFPEIAVTNGEIVPSGTVQSVQHLEGGIIAELLVAEGDQVAPNQVLARFDSANAQAELERMRARRAALALKHERLRARANGEEANFNSVVTGFERLKVEQTAIATAERSARLIQREVIEKQIAQQRSKLTTLAREQRASEQRLALVRDEVKMRKELRRRGFDSRLELANARDRVLTTKATLLRLKGDREAAMKAIEELKSRLDEVDRSRHETLMQELGNTSAELAETDELIRSLSDRVHRLEVRSPVAGVVQHLPLQTRRGVLPPGGIVAELVPADGGLVVETRVAPRDIGFVHPGQPVRLKFQAYDFSRFGAMDAELESLSATTFVDDQGESYYKARVLLAEASLGSNDRPLLPGMTVQADIVTGSKTLLEYLLKPIHRNLDAAFAER